MKLLTITDGELELQIAPHNEHAVWFIAEHAEWKVSNAAVFREIQHFFHEEVTSRTIEVRESDKEAQQ